MPLKPPRWYFLFLVISLFLVHTVNADAAPGSAIDFGGTDDYVSFSSAPQASLDAITVSWWLKVPSGAAAWNDWWTIQVSGGAELVAEIDSAGSLQMYIVNGSISGGVQFGDTAGYGGSTVHDLRDGQWHHLLFTASTGAATVYLDGTAISPTVNWQASDSVTGFAVSARLSDTVNRQIESTIDEMAVYDKHFSSSEVATLYNSGQGVYGESTDTGLIAGWHFVEYGRV